VYPCGNGWIGGVLCSRVAQNWSGLRRSEGRVDICGLESGICHVVRNPQLGIIGLNRRCSSDMDSLFIIVVNKWNFGRGLRKKLYELLDLE
jgi:hypothetical protein